MRIKVPGWANPGTWAPYKRRRKLGDYTFKAFLAVAVIFQLAAGLTIMTALMMILLNGFGLLPLPA